MSFVPNKTNPGGKALAGFLLSGFLLAFLGAILPAWGYNRDSANFTAAGNYFLCLAVGLVVSTTFARTWMVRKGLSFLLKSACILCAVAIAYLALVSPPYSAWWRAPGLVVLGIGAGLLNLGLFHAISKDYHEDAARTVTLGGIWYGVGCLAATLLVAATLYPYTVASILIFMALVPAAFAGMYAKTNYALPSGSNVSAAQAFQDFRSPSAILFALLVFFQFGNEYSLAGWLPIFLMRRLGTSPVAALLILALYWAFLTGGRLAAIALLPRVRHGRVLLWSTVLALFGCTVLYLTKTLFGAASGALFLGAGYASVYPLVAEAIGKRFPYYHPGFFNGIFSVALVGGLLAPATLGWAASAAGIGVVVGIPLLGTWMVILLVLLVWLEAKISGR